MRRGLELAGNQVNLRLVRDDDAAFVHKLRSDGTLSKYLSPVSGTVEDQRNWIIAYKDREASEEEFYFVIENKGGEPCGLVRLYEIQKPQFTWGSVILAGNKPRLAALEATLLSLEFGFGELECELAKLDVRKENIKAISFYQRFGMRQTQETETDYHFEISKSDLSEMASKHKKVISGNG